MSGQSNHSRRKGARAATWAGLVLVPALAIVALGAGVLPALFDSHAPAAVPSGLLLAETRAFTVQGDDVSLVKDGATDPSMDRFMDTWQNTVRPFPLRPSIRR